MNLQSDSLFESGSGIRIRKRETLLCFASLRDFLSPDKGSKGIKERRRSFYSVPVQFDRRSVIGSQSGETSISYT
jgi:hypothetical protein